MSFFAPVFYRAKIAAQREQKQVVAFGEMVAILCAQGRVEAAVQLEKMWNELLRRHNFSLRCAYPLNDRLGAERYAQICEEHDEVLAPLS